MLDFIGFSALVTMSPLLFIALRVRDKKIQMLYIFFILMYIYSILAGDMVTVLIFSIEIY